MTTKKERAQALARMTKAELVKTVVALDARQTKLLNEIAEMRGPAADPLSEATNRLRYEVAANQPFDASPSLPWEQE